MIFFEPKSLYRKSKDEVPVDDFILALEKAEIVKEGKHLTVVTYGPQVEVALLAASQVEKNLSGVSIEVIDLQTVYPFDAKTVCDSVKRTSRCLVTHEAPVTGGIGAEVAAKVQQECFFNLAAPVRRVCGYDTPFPLQLEPFYLPNINRLVDAMTQTLKL